MIDSVLFLGFGGPTAPGEIMPFLRNVVFGRGIPDARLLDVEQHYLDVGGSSPYNELTERQHAGVERFLRAHGVGLPVYCGMRNWAPYMKDVIAQMNQDGRRHALGVILAFLLLNLEIADYFTTAGEPSLVFRFSGNFARDMTYTIAWAVFALGLVVAGIWRKLRAARYAGLVLLSVTLLKLFFHDLSRLNQLYRIGALAAVAVVAIFASFLYQKFLATGPAPAKETPPLSS